MITVAAIRMEQFGVQFYQASLTARDVNKLVRFEVLSYGDKGHQPVRGGKGKSKVNWDLLERRIAANEKSYQRQIIRKKIEELVQVLRAVPRGAQPAVHSGRGHHRVGGAAEVRVRRGRRESRLAEGARAGGHSASDRRAAPAARAPQRRRAVRSRRLSRARGHLRSAARGPRRPDVRHDQREAHAAQPVAPRVARGPPALCRREPRGGARRHSRADRARGLGAQRRHQTARGRPRPRGAGAARAGAEAALRVRPASAARARPRSSARTRGSSS